MLRRIRWSDADVVRFLGCYLTEPKSHVLFTRPSRALTEGAFSARAARCGVHLAAPTRMLFRDGTLFINGETHAPAARAVQRLSRLADRRALPPVFRPDRETVHLLYQWYRAGYIDFGAERGNAE
jgi:50S ribosomal protein L16 3-hydroxylase